VKPVGPVAAAPKVEAERRELHAAAATFEGFFTRMLLKSMREAQLSDGLFGTGSGADVYEGMFDEHLSQAVASGSPLGIAKMLEDQWNRDPDAARALRSYKAALESVAARNPGDASVIPMDKLSQVPDKEADPF
jgi:flagellar protein FlgJ